MESVSIFDIFKIGVGPSSSHTLGPWRAALEFVEELKDVDYNGLSIQLFGSLSKTGKGHATDKAVILGLLGHQPHLIDTVKIQEYLDEVSDTGRLQIGDKSIPFTASEDIKFIPYHHDRHPNTLIFEAKIDGVVIKSQLFASIGGGFIEREEAGSGCAEYVALPYPINHGEELLAYTGEQDCRISDIVQINEREFRSEAEIEKKIDELLETMLQCVYLGCTTDGILPGGLNVRRRAKSLCTQFTGKESFADRDEWCDAIAQSPRDFNSINKWISCFALAVNEQNAALSRVVTSPTNGAAGVIPAVLLYYLFFCDYQGKEAVRRFLFTAGEIGCLFKKGATISAAVGGCQAEIGVSSAMAAAALTEVLGGSPGQCLMAAEIAMEHHLGLTCDPIGGLVQVPCIERNALGAMKAITASNLAIMSDPTHAIVNLDTVIKTMWDTAQDMNFKYKETSEGGLAFHLPVINPSC